MNNSFPNILLINPWICDFAAYDFWAKPIGLLYIGSILKKSGYNISYIDLVDMMSFDRIDFEKTISLNFKKKVKIKSKWNIVKINDISLKIINGSTPPKKEAK